MQVNRWGVLSVGLVASLLGSFGDVTANAQVVCPPSISVEQKAAASNEWSIEYSKNPAALSSATIFEGPPEEQASLKYDDEHTTSSMITQTWTLTASDRGHWMVCGYTNTTALLRRKLPDDMRTCTVVLEPGVTFGAGDAVVKRAECHMAAQKPTR